MRFLGLRYFRVCESVYQPQAMPPGSEDGTPVGASQLSQQVKTEMRSAEL